MALRRTRAENLALSMLAREGIADLDTPPRCGQGLPDGHQTAAALISEIADAAERERLRRANPLLL